MRWLLLLILLCPAVSHAQARRQPQRKPAPAPATRWPIESLAVEGNHHHSKEQILAVAGLKIGQLAGKEEFEAARDRLNATGFFETVGYRFAPAPNGKGYAASFQVTEVEPVYPVRFEELGVPEKELISWLRSRDPLLGPRLPSTAPVLDRYAKSIQEYLAAHNRKEKIVARITPEGPDQFAIVFRPARSAPVVAEVSFEGNQAVPANALRDAISGVAVGVPYSEERFRQLLDSSVRPLYDAVGRIRVTFPKIVTQPAGDVQGLAVKVSVEEGPVYDLGGVRLDGETSVKPEDLLKAGDFKTGEVANFDRIAQGVERIRKALRRHGHMRAEADVQRQIDDRKKVVNLVIRLNPGPQFLFGKLNIEGLDIHGEAAIRKMWIIKEGKPFNADYPDYFLARVREEGLFENLNQTRSAIKVDDQTRTVDVTLYFR